MPKKVLLKDKGITLTFPDDATPEQITEVIRRDHYPKQDADADKSGYIETAREGLAVGMAQAKGAAATAARRVLPQGPVSDYAKGVQESARTELQAAQQEVDPDLRTSFEENYNAKGFWPAVGQLIKPRRVVSDIAQMAPGMTAALGTGLATTAAVSALPITGPVAAGLGIGASTLAGAAGMVTGSVVGGALEGAGSYEDVLASTGDEQKAYEAFDEMLAVSGVLNAPVFAGLFKVIPQQAKGTIFNGLKKLLENKAVLAGGEAATEWLEEVFGAMIEDDTYNIATAIEGAKQGINVLPASFVTGGIAAGVAHALRPDPLLKPESKPVVEEALSAVQIENAKMRKQADMVEKEAEPEPNITEQPIKEPVGPPDPVGLLTELMPTEVDEFFRTSTESVLPLRPRAKETEQVEGEPVPATEEENVVNEFFTELDVENQRRADLANASRTQSLQQETVSPAFTAETTVDIQRSAEGKPHPYKHLPFTPEEVGEFSRTFSNLSDENKAYMLAAYSMFMSSRAAEEGMTPIQWKEKNLAGFTTEAPDPNAPGVLLGQAVSQENLRITETKNGFVVEHKGMQAKAGPSKGLARNRAFVTKEFQPFAAEANRIYSKLLDVKAKKAGFVLADYLESMSEADDDLLLYRLKLIPKYVEELRQSKELSQDDKDSLFRIGHASSKMYQRLNKLTGTAGEIEYKGNDLESTLAGARDETNTRIELPSQFELSALTSSVQRVLSKIANSSKNLLIVSDQDAKFINTIGDTLRKIGIGVEYTDQAPPGKSAIFLNESQKAIIRQTTLNQGETDPRGMIFKAEDGRLLIRALSAHDASTGLHELAHMFILAAHPTIKKSVVEKTLGWFRTTLSDKKEMVPDSKGKKREKKWHQKRSVEQWGVLEHEAFARGAEVYLYTGKAPTPELEYLYSGMREMMASVYKDAKSIFPDLINSEVAKVYDTIFQPVYATDGLAMIIGRTQGDVRDRYGAEGVLEQPAPNTPNPTTKSGGRDRRRRVQGRFKSVNFDYMHMPFPVEKQFVDILEKHGSAPTVTHQELMEMALAADVDDAVHKMLRREGLTPHEAMAVKAAFLMEVSGLAHLLNEPLSEETIYQFNEGRSEMVKAIRDFDNSTGRLLEAQKIHLGPQTIAAALEAFGTKMTKGEMEQLMQVVGSGQFAEISNFYNEKIKGNTKLATLFSGFLYNNMLSGATQTTNIFGNFVMQNYLALHKLSAGTLDFLKSKFTGADREIFVAEAFDHWWALAGGFKNKRAWNSARQVLLTGKSEWHTLFDEQIGENVIHRYEDVLREMFGKVGVRGKAASVGVFAANAPTRGLQAMDVFFKSLYAQGEMNAINRAVRKLQKQGGDDAVKRYYLRMAQIEEKAQAKTSFASRMKSIPMSVLEGIAEPAGSPRHEAAQQAYKKIIIDARTERMAEHATFQDAPDTFTNAVISLKNRLPMGIGHVLFPFILTPVNVAKRSVELIPGLGIAAARASGFNWTETLAKQMEGAMLLAYVWGKVLEGSLVGKAPDDEEERRIFYAQGKVPYGFRIAPGQYASYDMAEPFGMSVGILADMYQKALEIEEANMDPAQKDKSSWELLTAATNVVTTHILDSFYTRNLTEMMTTDSQYEQFAARRASAFLPMSGFNRTMHRALEAGETGMVAQKDKSFLGTFAMGLPPGMFEQMKGDARVNGFGKPEGRKSSFMQEWLPWRASSETTDPVEQELVNNLAKYPGAPGQVVTINKTAYRIPDDIYYEYAIAVGTKLKQRLGDIVERPSYQTLSVDKRLRIVERAEQTIRRIELNRVKVQMRKAGLRGAPRATQIRGESLL